MTNVSGTHLNSHVEAGPGRGEARESPSSLPRYAEYKDSGLAWLGEVPAHWNIRRTKFLFDLMKRPVEDGDGIVTAFRDGQVTLRSNRRIDGFTNALQEIGYQGVRKGDLVIHAMDAFAGAIGASDSDGKSTPVYSVCNPKHEVSDSTYYAHLLRYMALGGLVTSLAKGIRERSTDFRWSDAGNLLLPVPEFEEQASIVAFLNRETGKIDALIAEQEKLLTLLAEKRQATISHAVTRGLNPNAPMKDSGVPWLGEVPAHWGINATRRHLMKSISNGIFKKKEEFGDGTLLINVFDIYRDDYLINYSLLDRAICSEHEKLSYQVRPGDLFFVRSSLKREGIAAVALATENSEPVVFECHLIQVRLDESVVTGIFANYLFNSSQFRYHMVRSAKVTTMTTIDQEAILSSPLLLPPLNEQSLIVDFLDGELRTLDDLKRDVGHAITLLKVRRSALIAAAVTGKIDVRGTVEQRDA